MGIKQIGAMAGHLAGVSDTLAGIRTHRKVIEAGPEKIEIHERQVRV
jgi:hypothetical protein